MKRVFNISLDISISKSFQNVRSKPSGYWEKKANQKAFFDDLYKSLDMKTMEDWYQITQQQVIDKGGYSLLKVFNNSLIQAITSVYSDFNWQIWKFKRVPAGFWKEQKNVFMFINYLGKQLNIKEIEDWYKISNEAIIAIVGYKAFGSLGGIQEILKKAYPEYPWNSFRFRSTPEKYWKVPKNRREFLDDFAKRNKIEKVEDWYLVPYSKYEEEVLPLLSLYNSVPNMLLDIYPEYSWKVWKFPRVPNEFWTDKQNQRAFMEDMRSLFNINSLDDWYKHERIQRSKIEEQGGAGLLRRFGGKLKDALKAIYPEHDWQDNKFKAPIWEDISAQRSFFDDLENNLNIKKKEEWYEVSQEEILNFGGKGLLNYYEGSHIKALCTVYSDFQWKIWKFKQVPNGFWHEKANQREFFLHLKNELNIKHWQDWYSVRRSDVEDQGGSTILKLYGGSIEKALEALFPDEVQSDEYWKSKQNQREFLERIAKKYNVSNFTDWYHIKQRFIEENGGRGLLKIYGGSHISAIIGNYPEYPWRIWLFDKVPKGFWDDDLNVKQVMDWVAVQLDLKTLDDWYGVTTAQMNMFGLHTLMHKHGGIYGLLTRVFPGHNWNPNFPVLSQKVQSLIFSYVKQLFPLQDVHSNYLHPSLVFDQSKELMELDIFIPQLAVALEYQGESHYKDGYLFKEEQLKRDLEKQEACKKLGITLITIPYWWDQSMGSIRATIHKYIPQIISNPGTYLNKNVVI